MSGRTRIEKDYRSFDLNIEQRVAEEIRRIKKKLDQVRVEAEKIGDEVENSINESETKEARKKR